MALRNSRSAMDFLSLFLYLAAFRQGSALTGMSQITPILNSDTHRECDKGSPVLFFLFAQKNWNKPRSKTVFPAEDFNIVGYIPSTANGFVFLRDEIQSGPHIEGS